MFRWKFESGFSCQIKMLTEQDLIRLHFFVDDLIHRQQQCIQDLQQQPASAVQFLANLRPIGIPGGLLNDGNHKTWYYP
jgi:hypothetical protein